MGRDSNVKVARRWWMMVVSRWRSRGEFHRGSGRGYASHCLGKTLQLLRLL